MYLGAWCRRRAGQLNIVKTASHDICYPVRPLPSSLGHCLTSLPSSSRRPPTSCISNISSPQNLDTCLPAILQHSLAGGCPPVASHFEILLNTFGPTDGYLSLSCFRTIPISPRVIIVATARWICLISGPVQPY